MLGAGAGQILFMCWSWFWLLCLFCVYSASFLWCVCFLFFVAGFVEVASVFLVVCAWCPGGLVLGVECW